MPAGGWRGGECRHTAWPAGGAMLGGAGRAPRAGPVRGTAGRPGGGTMPVPPSGRPARAGLLSAPAAAVIARTGFEAPPEGAAETRQIVEARIIGHFRHRHIRPLA